jgi:hypothetical protein
MAGAATIYGCGGRKGVGSDRDVANQMFGQTRQDIYTYGMYFYVITQHIVSLSNTCIMILVIY